MNLSITLTDYLLISQANTCEKILVEEPLRVERQSNGSLLRFSCAVMNRLEGTEIITCDGSMWSDTVPTCIRESVLQITRAPLSGAIHARWGFLYERKHYTI